MARSFQHFPSPDPNKYPWVGPNYQQYGEIEGMLYNPYDDKYYPDPKYQPGGANNGGQSRPGRPSLGTQVATGAAIAGTAEIAREVGRDVMSPPSQTPPPQTTAPAVSAPSASAQVGQQGVSSATVQPVATGTNAGGGLVGANSAQAGNTVTQGGVSAGAGSSASLAANSSAVQTPNVISVNRVPTGAGGQAASGSGSTGMSPAVQQGLSYAGGILGAYGMYDQLTSKSGKRDIHKGGLQTGRGWLQGSSVGGAVAGPVGYIVGGIIGAISGAVHAMTGSQKGQDQLERDAVRKGLRNAGIAGDVEDGQVGTYLTLADGSTYDIGKDGKFKYTNEYGNEYSPYIIDPDNKFGSQALGWTDPLSNILLGGKGPHQLGGFTMQLLSNAAISNAKTMEDVRQNILGFYEKAGLTYEVAQDYIKGLLEEEKISEKEYQSQMASLDTLYNGGEDRYVYGSFVDHMAPDDPALKYLKENYGYKSPEDRQKEAAEGPQKKPEDEKNKIDITKN